MNAKQNDVTVKDPEKIQGSTDDNNNRSGWFVSKPIAAIVALLMLFLVVGAVLIAYFIPTCSQGGSAPMWHSDSDGENETTYTMPPPTDIEWEEREPFDGRLPASIDPINYWIHLRLFLDDEDGDRQFTFDGKLHFTFVCKAVTSLIILHQEFLSIHADSMTLKTEDMAQELKIRDVMEDGVYNFLIIETEKAMQVGQTYILSLSYNGTMQYYERLGLYYMGYYDNGQIRYIAATQLQSVFARRMFPCLDEPKFKAQFTMAVTHRRRRQAYGNMPIDREENHEEDWVTSYFEPSVVMSTYLVAIVVANFECKATTTDKGINLQVCAIPGKVDSVDYSLNIGSKLLTYFDDMLGLPYSPSKMDMVALPNSMGAMENWGLVIYGESTLLYDEAIHSNTDLQTVARIVVHEIAHQWFGNVVTCSWWSDLWLNEGFARYLEGIGLEHVEPDWQYQTQFYPVDATYRAMDVDSKSRSSHPVVMPSVGWPDENEMMFDDAITYSKGGCLSTMMEMVIGKSTYRSALRAYMNQHQYTSIMSDQLLQVLSQATQGILDQSMDELMNPWLYQAGYPIVSISRSGSRTFHADQEIFFQYKNDKPHEMHPHTGYKWHIPLSYTYQSNIDLDNPHITWMNLASTDIELPTDSTPDDWLLVNIDQKGYYRVNYDLQNWDRLAQQLLNNHTIFSARTRGSLIADAMNIAKAQKLGMVVSLKLMQYLVNERDYLPWYTVTRYISYAKDMLGRTSTYWHFQKYLSDLATPRHDELGWDLFQGTHLDAYNRLDALTIACQFGSPVCIEHATYHWNRWKETPNNYTIRKEVKYIVFCMAIRYRGPEEWNFAFERQKNNDYDSLDLQSALGCSLEPWALQRYLDYALENELIWSALTDVKRGSGLGLTVALDFVFDHFDELHTRYSESAFAMLFGFSDYMNTRADLERLESFGKQHQDMGPYMEYYQSLDIIRNNIDWMDKNHQEIHDWLMNIAQQDPEYYLNSTVSI